MTIHIKNKKQASEGNGGQTTFFQSIPSILRGKFGRAGWIIPQCTDGTPSLFGAHRSAIPDQSL